MKNLKILLLFLIITNSAIGQDKKAFVENSVEDYKRHHLRAGNVPEQWEDGIRTEGKKGTYEWWYYDAHLEDGTTVVIVFYTKPFTQIKKGLTPLITINIDKADGSSIHRAYFGKADEFSAADSSCNVIIGKNYFRGDLKNYEIHFEDKALVIDATFHRTTESWRPNTGFFKYGDKGKQFAWLVPVPQGETEMSITYRGEVYTSKGSCYHDHNFGNASMTDVINHWYWARAELGPYTLIAAELISVEKYDSEPIIVYNLSKDGKTLADESKNVKLYRTYGKMETNGGKPVSDELIFVYEKENLKYEFTLKRKKNLIAVKLLNVMIGNRVIRYFAKLITGFDGSYYRFQGDANLKVYDNNCLVEEFTGNKAIWELMFFGK